MRTFAALSCLLWLAPSFADDSGAAGAYDAAQSVATLAWLAGCWASETAEPGSGEHWLPPAGGTLLGVSRTIRAGKTVEHEFMQIREIAPERVAFIADPSGQSRATFPARTVTATEVVFENPDHDFPQRVIYRLEPDGMLRARIEGLRNGTAHGVDFPMKRVRCANGEL